MRSCERLLFASAFGAALAVAVPARASEIFPPEIRQVLELEAEPNCTICHATNSGGLKTVVKPFGIKMQSRGLLYKNLPSLRIALAALEAEGSDVDGDGASDIDELRDGTDPNVSSSGEAPLVPDYGCSVGSGPSSAGSAGSGWAVLGLGVLAALAWMRGRKR
jgi:hypothetical protein